MRARGVGVCSVVGFPLGATTADVKGYETRRAIFDGAREIDMVINVGALKSGDLRVVERDIEAVVAPCRECGVLSKVIIEAALLTDDEKVTACTLAKAAGADYVKTSTGFGPGGATAADVALMRRVVGADMGVKAAGGVRDLEGREGHDRGRRDARRRERRRQDRPAGARRKDDRRGALRLLRPRYRLLTATPSISKCPPRSSEATPMNARDGMSLANCARYAALNLSYSARSVV